MERIDKSVISYISNTTDFSDVDLRVEVHHGKKYLIAYVDVEKVDPNGPKYDPLYDEKLTERNLMRKRRNEGGLFIHNANASLSRRLNAVKKFFGDDVDYEIAFLPKNYKYLDDIEEIIRKELKKINQDYDVKFSWDSDYPSPRVTIYSGSRVNYEDINLKYGNANKFISYIDEKLGGKIKLNEYSWGVSSGKKQS